MSLRLLQSVASGQAASLVAERRVLHWLVAALLRKRERDQTSVRAEWVFAPEMKEAWSECWLGVGSQTIHRWVPFGCLLKTRRLLVL